MKSNDVFTTSDVAIICRVSTRIVTKWFDRGILGGYRLPGSKHRRFTRTHIRDFMAKQEMPLDWLDEAVEWRKTGQKLKVLKGYRSEEEIEAEATHEPIAEPVAME